MDLPKSLKQQVNSSPVQQNRPIRDLLVTLAGRSFVYAVGDLLSKGLSFLLIPLYVRYLGPEEYGIIGLALALIAILNIVLNLQLHGSIAILYTTAHTENAQERHWGSVWLFAVFIGGLITVLFDQFGETLSTILFEKVTFHPYVRLALWSAFFNSCFFLFPLAIFRIQERAISYTIFSVGQALLLTFFVSYWVVFRKQGAAGYLSGMVWSNGIVAACSIAILARRIEWKIDFSWLRQSIILSFPLMPQAFMLWGLNISDRIILERYVSLSAIGIYTLGYQAGAIMAIAMAAFNNAYYPFFLKSMKSPSGQNEIAKIIPFLITGIIGMGALLSWVIPLMVPIILPEQYKEAARIAPWVIGGFTAHGLYYIPVNYLLFQRATQWLPIVTGIAAGANLSLNFFLVPKFGIQAAAWSTLIGYVVLLATTTWIAHGFGFYTIFQNSRTQDAN